MTKIIDGKALSLKLQDSIKEKVNTLISQGNRAPHLAVIIVGEDPASQTYVRNKARACEKVGFRNTTISLDEKISESELLLQIDKLNNDDETDGILVQLPLPKHINETKIINAISDRKDVDGFHALNTAALWQKRRGEQLILPCTPKGIMHLFKEYNIDLVGKKAVVIGRSQIVGLPMAKLLLDANATVSICHSRTANLSEYTLNADIVVVAIGSAKFLKADMVKDGAVIIDVGIDRDPETARLCGDVDFDRVSQKSSYITPVPGGVGPMTIACLMENTLVCFTQNISKD